MFTGLRISAGMMLLGVAWGGLAPDIFAATEPLALVGGSALPRLTPGEPVPGGRLVWRVAARADEALRMPEPLGRNSRASGNEIAAPSFSEIEIAPDGRVRFLGRGTPGARVTLNRYGRPLGSAMVTPRGDWEVLLATGLGAGEHMFNSVAAPAGNGRTIAGEDVRIAIPRAFGRDGGSDSAHVDAEVARSVEREAEQRRRAEQLAGEASRRFDEFDRLRMSEAPAPGQQVQPGQPAPARGPGAAAPASGAGGASDAEGSWMFWIQDWLARANRDYQGKIVRRLQVPNPGETVDEAPRATAGTQAPGTTAEVQVRDEERKAAAAADARDAEAARLAEEQRKAEAGRQVLEQRKAEAARQAEEQRKAEAARQAEEQRKADAARQAEEQRKADAARQAEEQRKADAARLAEEQRKADAARQAEEQRKADAARQAEEQRKADAARQAEAQRRAAEEKAARDNAAAEDAARQKAAVEAEAAAAKAAALRRQERDRYERELLAAEIAERQRRAAEAEERRRAQERRRADERQQLAQKAPRGSTPAGTSPATAPPRALTAQPKTDSAGRTRQPGLRGGDGGSDGGTPAASAAREAEPSASVMPEAWRRLAEARERPRIRGGGGDERAPKDGAGMAGTRTVVRTRCARAGRRIELPGTYVVRRGDSLWRISARHYSGGHLWPAIHRANDAKIDDPDLIYPCQRFYLPKLRRSR